VVDACASVLGEAEVVVGTEIDPRHLLAGVGEGAIYAVVEDAPHELE
jgi:hypothetical protein